LRLRQTKSCPGKLTLNNAFTIDGFADRLLTWFDQHGRKNLPWQQDTTPYRVWVSEIMLQQTQVKTVIPYFERFVSAFPSVWQLAEASEDQVLHHWTGLGYYARARNLHKSAKQVVLEYNGEFPLTIEALIELPGIGLSTAGAIMAISANKRATILDGNVKRVLARCYSIEGWPGNGAVAKELWRIAEKLTPETRVADYTQAIMDLGATLCTRTSPQCTDCPFGSDCSAHQHGREAEFPTRKPKKVLPVKKTTMFLIENPQREFLLQQRPPSGVWGGLWSFPEGEDATTAFEHLLASPAKIATQQNLQEFRHTFTHFHLDISPIHVKLAEIPLTVGEQALRWFAPSAPDEIGLTKPVTRLLKEIG
jgi:A/G-specific adenine glycosylase